MFSSCLVTNHDSSAPPQPTQTLLPHEIKSDDITIESETILGDTDFSQVYKGTWKQLDVAVKIFKKGVTYSAVAERKNEIDILSKLAKSDNIIKFYGYVNSKNMLYQQIVMEYMPVGSLGDFIENNPHHPLDVHIRYKIMRQMTQAVGEVHSAGYLHRDIKSFNVLLDNHYRVKLIDFGFACPIDNKTKRSVGSLPWLAPESIKKAEYSCKSDVYSLACVYWELMSWQPEPYSYDLTETKQLMREIAVGKRETIPANTPSKVAGMITLGWMTKPAKRPTVTELLEAMETDIDVPSAQFANVVFQ